MIYMPIGIDIFSGAGGLSLGAEMAGIRIKFAVERDWSAADTYEHNHSTTIMLRDNIHPLICLNWKTDKCLPFKR